MRDLNQYLQQRGQRWHYVRRVPNEYSDFDKRTIVRKALRTESLEVARARRDLLVKADDAFWAGIANAADGLSNETAEAEKTKRAIRKYNAAKQRAMQHGFMYLPVDELVEQRSVEELVLRVEKLRELGRGGLASKQDTDALLGGLKKPTITFTQAFEIYCTQIAMVELSKGSASQQKSRKKVKLRAVNNFKKLNGDLAMDKITRQHAREFYNWWAKRLRPSENQKPLSANSANRDLGNLRKFYREFWEFEGEEDRQNPFRNLNFTDTGPKDIPHFEDEWIQQNILKPRVFSGLNPQATLLIYALIETGCRPSEIANLMPENIVLDSDVPHIRIRARKGRQLKSASSTRDIPLVGVSLAAFRKAPDGFPHYLDKGSLLSASLMKAFRSRGLFPSKDHRIYSFRHSFEKRMLEAGLDFGLRCLLMGHKNSRPSYGDGGSMAYRRDELLKIAHPVPNGFERKLPLA